MVPKNIIFDSNSDIFEIDSIDRQADTVILSVSSKQPGPKCPKCAGQSRRLHSYYIRTLKDLPAFGCRVIVNLKARKFYCHNIECDKKVFCEHFPDHFFPYKRSTRRLSEKLLKIALLMGGNAGERLCRTLNIPVSSSSLIRCIHQKELIREKPSPYIGIDDWAYKKGHTYGTAIVDLKNRRIVDLLPDRESQSIQDWLSKQHGVKIVTRDRYAKYAKGVTEGAPKATQVADRWHLLKNMGDSIKKLLERKKQEIRRQQIAKAVKASEKATANDNNEFKVETRDISKRMIQMQEIKKMSAKGMGTKTIARALGISRNTVRKYIHLDDPPRKDRSRLKILLFADYFHSRIKQNPNVEVMQLWKEIKEKGYNGGRSAVYEFLKGHTKSKNKNLPSFVPHAAWVPSKVSLLLYREKSKLSINERELLNKLRKISPDINATYYLAQQFRMMMENRQGVLLKGWIEEVLKSPVNELKGFAKGLLSDFRAVKNALTLPWSNGQVEGQINKLKTIKRQMYGRAGFNLLRKRMILGAG